MLITNATVLTFDPTDPLLTGVAIYIKDGRIEKIAGSALEQKYLTENRINASGFVILPGMIIPHFHIYGTFARGIPLKGNPPQNFLQNLQKLWWRLDKKLTEENIRYSAYAALLDCIKAGTTTLFDHHASPNTVKGSLDVLAEVFSELGLRGCLCYEVSDRDGEQVARAGMEENVRFATFCRQHPSGLLSAKFGLHASFTLSDPSLAACRELAEQSKSGFHFHLGEGTTDRQKTFENYGYESPVKRLDKFGILNEKTFVAHAIDVNEEELKILNERGVIIVHNPQSNMKNGVGFSDVEKMLEQGILTGLGTDGMTASLFKEIQSATLLPKYERRNPSAGGGSIYKIVTENHKKIASSTFQVPLGEIKESCCADLIFIKYDPPTPLNKENYWYHLLFGLANLPVEHTMVNGRFLMKNREILACDEEKIMAQARKCAEKLWERF